MNIIEIFRNEIDEAVARLVENGQISAVGTQSRFTVEPPRDPSHGDFSSNAAMVLARSAGMPPRDLAREIAASLADSDTVASVEVAGPGFLNIRVVPRLWSLCIGAILDTGTDYGNSQAGAGQPVNVEYVSANPTGPMHVGHGRGAVIGDVLAALLSKAGYAVSREYYVNDAGAQIDALGKSLHWRYREILGETMGSIPEGLYPGDYLVPVARQIAETDGDRWQNVTQEEFLPRFRDYAVTAMLVLIREDLAALGVHHDVFRSERDLGKQGAIESVVEALGCEDLVYKGILEPPKGLRPDDWEEREQLLFRSTRFGDDTDRPLQKSDGTWTYFAADMAYHLDKYRRGFSRMVNVWGADHKGYVKRMQAAVAALTDNQAELDVRICNLVNLSENGVPVRMSKRTGNFVTLREVVDQVGRDAVRFIMLTRGDSAPLDFDLGKVLEQSRDNPVFYVQYAHARTCSVMRTAREALPGVALDDSSLQRGDLALIDHEAEVALIRSLAGWPRLVEAAAAAREPHRIALYLMDVAASFHALWNRGNDEESLRFVRPGQPDVTLARLALVRATAIVIASGLEVMGVQPVEEMR